MAPSAVACCDCCAPVLPAMARTSSSSPIDPPERDLHEQPGGNGLLQVIAQQPAAARVDYTLTSSERSDRLLLLGDYEVLDLVVGGLGNDLLLYEVSLFGVRAAVDNFLSILFADARESVELVLGSRVDVHKLRGGGRCSWFRLRRGGAGLRDSNADSE